VPNLTSANVMLIDSDGETLGDNDEMAQMSELSVVQQNYKTKEEKKRQKKIVEVVSPFVGGENRVVAQVTIEYDFSIQSSTSETFDPENVVRSEQIVEEKRDGSTPQEVGGVPGTVSNIGPVEGLANNKSTEKYEKSSGTTNYEVGKTVSTTKSEFARIKNITAAVVVDGKYKYKADADGKPTEELEYEALQESDLEALRALVSRSIGISEARGDQISVQNLQFKKADVDPSKEKVGKVLAFAQTYMTPFAELFKYIFVLILLLVLYKKVITPFAQKMLEVSKEDDEHGTPVFSLEGEDDEDLIEKVQTMRKKVENQLGVGDDVNEDELKHEVLLEKIKTMIEDSPEAVAQVLQVLLTEENETMVR